MFGHLLQGRFPTLWAHLQALEVNVASVTMHWFICCFLTALPLDSTLRGAGHAARRASGGVAGRTPGMVQREQA